MARLQDALPFLTEEELDRIDTEREMLFERLYQQVEVDIKDCIASALSETLVNQDDFTMIDLAGLKEHLAIRVMDKLGMNLRDAMAYLLDLEGYVEDNILI